jgi:hypothetical protein
MSSPPFGRGHARPAVATPDEDMQWLSDARYVGAEASGLAEYGLDFIDNPLLSHGAPSAPAPAPTPAPALIFAPVTDDAAAIGHLRDKNVITSEGINIKLLKGLSGEHDALFKFFKQFDVDNNDVLSFAEIDKARNIVAEENNTIRRYRYSILCLIVVVLALFITVICISAIAADKAKVNFEKSESAINAIPAASPVGGSPALSANGAVLRAAGAALTVNASAPWLGATSAAGRRLAASLGASLESDHAYPYIAVRPLPAGELGVSAAAAQLVAARDARRLAAAAALDDATPPPPPALMMAPKRLWIAVAVVELAAVANVCALLAEGHAVVQLSVPYTGADGLVHSRVSFVETTSVKAFGCDALLARRASAFGVQIEYVPDAKDVCACCAPSPHHAGTRTRAQLEHDATPAPSLTP